jgi:hypothetical protein
VNSFRYTDITKKPFDHRARRRQMKRGTAFALGFFGGIIAGVFAMFEVFPSVNAVVMMPLKWLLDDLHPFPSESPAKSASPKTNPCAQSPR